MKKAIYTLFILSAAVIQISAQETALDFFNHVSEHYSTVDDYVCQAEITHEDEVQEAEIKFKSPNLLHIEFSKPAGMVINSNDDKLQLFTPEHRVTFIQDLRGRVAGMASSQGLDLLKRNYTIGYLDNPSPQPLDNDNPEMVVKLKLNWKSANEGFREMVVSIGEDKLIRRIKAVTTKHKEIQFDFFNIRVNRNLPDSIFDYNPPPVGNSIENFLFETEE